jgi:hypothetical protein
MVKGFVATLVVIVGCFVVGAVFLGTWKIPAPSQTIEKTLKDETFPK